jgi:hypothetical protein
MPGLTKSKVDEILEYLRGKMLRDDDIPRIENLLKRNIDAGASDDEEDLMPVPMEWMRMVGALCGQQARKISGLSKKSLASRRARSATWAKPGGADLRRLTSTTYQGASQHESFITSRPQRTRRRLFSNQKNAKRCQPRSIGAI